MPDNKSTPPPFALWSAAEDAAQKYGVDPQLIHRIIETESSYNPNAVSKAGAIGLMQLMPDTAKGLGVDPHDPLQNIDGGTRYFSQLMKRYGGDTTKALTAYQSGPGNLDAGNIGPEGRAYAPTVLRGMNQQQQSAAPQDKQLPDFAEWNKAQDAAAAAGHDSDSPSIMGFLNNALNSGGKFAEGLFDAVTSPKETAKNLGKLAAGGVEKLGDIGGFKTVPIDMVAGDQRPLANAAGQMYADRYGGIDKILKTLYTDPVGALADVASVAEPLAGGAKAIGKLAEVNDLSNVAKVARTVGTAADTVATYTNPLNAIAKPLEKIAPRIAGAQLPINKRFVDEYEVTRPMLGKVILDNGINTTTEGAKTLDNARGVIAGQKTALEQKAIDQLGRRANADPRALVTGAQDLANTKGIGIQATPAKDLAAVQDVVDEFLNRYKTPVPLSNGTTATAWSSINPLDLEQMKQGTYAGLRNTYTQDMPTAGRQANQAIARGMKQHLETVTNQVADQPGQLRELNHQDKMLGATSHAIGDMLNKDARGGIGIGGASEMLLGGSGHILPAALLHLARNPTIENMIARLFYNVPGPAARVATPATALNNALTAK